MIPTIPDTIRLFSSAFAAQFQQPYTATHFGPAHPGRLTEAAQRIILHSVASQCIDTLGGGIVEIGCAEGCTSVVLGQLARAKGKTLTCIDPYDGNQEGTEALYRQFVERTTLLGDSVKHHRVSSLDLPGIQAAVDAKPSFVFVDGLHYEWAAYRDILTAYQALPPGGIVCVDDTNMMGKDAGAAFRQAVGEGLFILVVVDPAVEKALYGYKSWHFGVRV